MNVRRNTAVAATLAGLPLAGTLLLPQLAFAHGDMQEPAGRAYTCYLEGAETPQSEGCRGVQAENGPAPVYDWMSNRIGDADGRHQELIPDGKLCSANNPTYSGFDQPATAWPTTELTPGDVSLEYKATAKHAGYFDVYITKDDWDPTQPLSWDSLEDQPIAHVENPPDVGEGYQLNGHIPESKNGQHVLYTVWQRTDSPEAFYSCSDVMFGSAGTAQTDTLRLQEDPSATDAVHDHGHAPESPSTEPGLWDRVLTLFS
ncbi:lytic polysaccharide monooxygenase [Saccharopolyspora sp. HNM0983]|uniref:Lytic polysaccharide monooxygenase n=1 Tax=Saccharopolyspora montiporae TaxID=2781240 RepID=A0A929FYG7_9PSEU|nr:lytic polysaccharide monooxygenase [Saccharopolyspora sp. HNM0983]MBE9375771.1 lytic polysaccharide monooxygenase [Saccharopolyspora sp. HNM0983]